MRGVFNYADAPLVVDVQQRHTNDLLRFSDNPVQFLSLITLLFRFILLYIFCLFVSVSLQAISSLNKYPLPLQTAKEAKILQNFGDGICKLLDNKLQRYRRENGKRRVEARVEGLRFWLKCLLHHC